MVNEVYNGLRDDLATRRFLAVSAEASDFYDQSEPLFGREVDAQFPSIIYEIEESGKCYALDRSTAAAFHAIRCLEAGVRALSRSLGIPDPTRGAERSWGSLLRAIREELEKRWPASTGRMTGDAQLFDNMYGALSGMANPYRNATMHLDEKYTLEEAKHIFEVVKGFMQKLAVRMDENGLPLA